MSESAAAPAAAGSMTEALGLVGKYGAKARQHALEAKQHKEALAAALEENKALKAANAKLQGDLDAAAKTSATPDEKDATIAKLQGEITAGKHRAVFAKAAKAAGVREDAIDDLYIALGHKAEGEPDEKTIGELIAGAKTAKGWAWPSEAPKPGETPPPAPKPVPGGGRGAPNSGGDGTIVTREQLADPMFMLNPANKDVIRAAAKEGRFR